MAGGSCADPDDLPSGCLRVIHAQASRPRVIYWLRQPTPYYVTRLNAVAHRGNLDLEAWFSVERESDRSWSVDSGAWEFPARYIPRRRSLGGLHVPTVELRRARPDLFILEYDRANLALGALAGRATARRLAFLVLPNYDAWSQRTWWREAAKHFLFRAVDGAEVSGPEASAMARRYGLPDDRSWRVDRSISVTRYSRARYLSPDARQQGRDRLGLRGCVFLYVGRLWRGKGLDHLLDAYRRLRASNPEVSLLLVGDGVDEAHYRAQAATIPGVVFAGFVEPELLPNFYALADVFVFPTLGDPHGLVVEEAMLAAMPVISSSAAGEIRSRVPEGEAGFIVPPGDAEALEHRMATLAANPALRAAMGKLGANLASGRSDGRFAVQFEAFVAAVLAAPRRRSASAQVADLLGHLVLASGGRMSADGD